MAQLRMRQRTETFIDAFADTEPGLGTTSSEGSRASGQSTDTALAMPPLLAADAPLPTAPADGNSYLHADVFLSNDADIYFLSDFASRYPDYTFTVLGGGRQRHDHGLQRQRHA
jgi:hypothetical protein